MKKRYTSYSLLLFFFYFLVCELSAQSDCTVTSFNTEKSLSYNTITGMSFDDDGYLWLGTLNGLVRYDGFSFKTYNFSDSANNSFSSLSNVVLQIFNIRKDKAIIIRTKDGLVYTVKNGKPVLYSSAVKEKLYDYNIAGYFPDKALFDQFNLPIDELVENRGWSPEERNILPVNETDFIVRSGNDSILLYYKKGIEQKKIQLNFGFGKFLKIGNADLLSDKQGRFYVFSPTSYSFESIGFNWSKIKKIEKDKMNVAFYWDTYNDQSYCFFNSIFYFLKIDTADKIITPIPLFTVNSEDRLWKNIIYNRENQTYFLSTVTDGLFQVKLKKIQTFNLHKYLPSNVDPEKLMSFSVLKTNDSTIVSPSGVEMIITNGAARFKRAGDVLSFRRTIGLLSDGSILCAVGKQLYYFLESESFKKKHAYNAVFNEQNNSLIELLYPEGDSVWVSTPKALWCISKNNCTNYMQVKDDKESRFFGLQLFYRISNTEIFISNLNGLYKLNTERPSTCDTFPEMKGKVVSNITAYKDMLILSVYYEGLYVLKNKKFLKVPLNAANAEIALGHSTYIDERENIWIPTDKGLFKSKVASIIKSVSKPGDLPFFFRYGIGDGITNMEFNGSGTPSYAVFKSGQLFYPSMGGIVTFNPQEMDDSLIRNAVLIDDITINDKLMANSLADSLYLQTDFKHLYIDLGIPFFGDPKNLVVEYRLDNTVWGKISFFPTPRISIYEVSPGFHTLLIRRRFGFGNTDYTYKSIVIYKAKHIYEQWGFYVLLILSIFLLVFLIIKLKTKNLIRKRIQLQNLVNEQTAELSKTVESKKLIINIVSHDMVAPLKYIGFMSDMLRKGEEQDPGKVNKMLGLIKSTSDNIVSGSQRIITYMKYNSGHIVAEKTNVNLYLLVEELLEVFTPIAEEKNISLKNEIPKSEFTIVDYTILATILNNLISNSIRYTDRGEIRIFFSEGSDKTKAILKVRDSGLGMNNQTLQIINETLKGNIQVSKAATNDSTGLGYILISELLKVEPLSILVESELEKGTTVTIEIPR